VLDITAAPGSKTSQIASIMGNTGEIIAVDNNAIRIDKLAFTLKRQGVKNTIVIKTDARKLSEPLGEILVQGGGKESDVVEYFDNILFDAPCSAEGRINFNKEKTYAFWKEEIFKKNYRLSKQILETIIPMLKKGGTLIFSTCTLAPEENEAITHLILSNFPDMKISEISLDNENIRPGIKSFGKQIYRNDVTQTIRCLPSQKMEGFYIAKLKRVA
ncbi:MAG: RsmB/NOP family class I SAM-dependent RNA methyltransferase, partial [Candidatus Gracilibacteria bacterium]|nr:RsmB/NOP family class I SAM-dependent RNA methyltransferase [Candidatus Gracilibacteria bacterium]